MDVAHAVHASPVEGTAGAVVIVDADPPRVYEALTQPRLVAGWLGDLDGPLTPGSRRRLDFGDGDFFAIDEISVEPPTAMTFHWRFLGIMPSDTVRWTIEPWGAGARVTVTDTDSLRSPEWVESLREGWEDFTARLALFLSSGESTRYDWRRAFEGGIELPCDPDEAMRLVTIPSQLTQWLPIDTGLRAGAALDVRDGLQPAVVTVGRVMQQGPHALHFELGSAAWSRPTRCALEVHPRGSGALLSVTQTGWEEIDEREDVQLSQRRRFAGMWIAALGRAADRPLRSH